jgi:esterase/lipase superfamily enzyme
MHLRRVTNVVSVLYGTDRVRTGSPTNFDYNGERARRLELGDVEVSIPPNHKAGIAERPPTFDLLIFKIELPANPKTNFVITSGPRVLTPDEFVQLASQRAQAGAGLLFVHGYNESFDDGLYRTAQLAFDFRIAGPAFYYSFPSRNNTLQYGYDVDSQRAAEPYFEDFLRQVIVKAGVRKLTIIAHSRGNDLVLTTLNKMASQPDGLPQGCCGQLILASPDVEAGYAENNLPAIVSHFDGVTLYANDKDRALAISRGLAGGPPRLGELQQPGNQPVLMSGMDSIDATAARTTWFDVDHDAYVADDALLMDIKKAIQGVKPPDHRSKRLVPVHVPTPPGEYWRLSPMGN